MGAHGSPQVSMSAVGVRRCRVLRRVNFIGPIGSRMERRNDLNVADIGQGGYSVQRATVRSYGVYGCASLYR